MPTLAAEPTERSPSATASLSSCQIARLSGVSDDDLLMLVEYGLLCPVEPGIQPFSFDIGSVALLKRAVLVRADLALDSHGFAMAVKALGSLTSER